jgi:hypothetical protein
MFTRCSYGTKLGFHFSLKRELYYLNVNNVELDGLKPSPKYVSRYFFASLHIQAIYKSAATTPEFTLLVFIIISLVKFKLIVVRYTQTFVLCSLTTENK